MNIKERLTRWKNIRQTQNELTQLTDRELNDIGIYRNDIPRIARTTY